MPVIKFIGGHRDGEVQKIDNPEFQKVFVQMKPWVVHDVITPNKLLATGRDREITEYRLEKIHSYGVDYYFYVDDRIGSEKWIKYLIDGYKPGNGNLNIEDD